MPVSEKILIGLTATKEEDFMEWYRQSIIKSDMTDYTDISGCYVLRPLSYGMWEKIQKYVDAEIKKMGVENAYFPLFVSKKALETEKSHIEGFSPEVAWVTKAGDSNLSEPLAIRPTSETSMYPIIKNWIKSYRDLPLKINQWCNVVRWEFKDPLFFIRSREFLWSETHTCHNTKEEADAEVLQSLDLYADVYQKLLAVPVIQGRKSVGEKFAGADYTTTIECYIPTVGKAVQGATSHCLGQNFSKMFDIYVEDNQGNKKNVYQNSWGITTRTIGVMVMVHGDNRGLVIPPSIAPLHVIIVACGITSKTSEDDADKVKNACDKINTTLNDNGITCKIDSRTNYSVGHKFNYWELRGVPIRIETGPKDIKNDNLCIVRRDTGQKINFSKPTETLFLEFIRSVLEEIQKDMYKKAVEERNTHIKICNNTDSLSKEIGNRNICLATWCEEVKCEEDIVAYCKSRNLGAKSLCIPFNQMLAAELSGNKSNVITEDSKCFNCSGKAKSYALFGSSF